MGYGGTSLRSNIIAWSDGLVRFGGACRSKVEDETVRGGLPIPFAKD
jgi:hypothetical protein